MPIPNMLYPVDDEMGQLFDSSSHNFIDNYSKKSKAKSSTLKYSSIPCYASWFWETYLDTLIMNKKDIVQSLSTIVWTFLMKTQMVWSDENIQFRLTLT